MRCSSLIGYEYNLPRAKAHLQYVSLHALCLDRLISRSSINMVGTVKTMIREQLTSNSQIALSGEFNPFYDEYKFGYAFSMQSVYHNIDCLSFTALPWTSDTPSLLLAANNIKGIPLEWVLWSIIYQFLLVYFRLTNENKHDEENTVDKLVIHTLHLNYTVTTDHLYQVRHSPNEFLPLVPFPAFLSPILPRTPHPGIYSSFGHSREGFHRQVD